jgi:hypothetical protein
MNPTYKIKNRKIKINNRKIKINSDKIKMTMKTLSLVRKIIKRIWITYYTAGTTKIIQRPLKKRILIRTWTNKINFINNKQECIERKKFLHQYMDKEYFKIIKFWLAKYLAIIITPEISRLNYSPISQIQKKRSLKMNC